MCPHGHTFDMASEGYVNLLRKKLPGDIGDTKAMLSARRQFLAGGSYCLLSDTINECVYTSLHDEHWLHNEAAPVHILDVGCGEGYYLGRLQQYLSEKPSLCLSFSCIGLDVSKEAVKMAAKRYKEVFFVVANLKERVVVSDASVHAMLNIFAPRNAAEFSRVMAPGGWLVVVIPSTTHLLQLRVALHLLNIEEHKQERVIEQFVDCFTLCTVTPISYTVHLCHEEIMHIVTMTPNYWHLSEATRQAMDTLEEMDTEVACTCLIFRRKGGQV